MKAGLHPTEEQIELYAYYLPNLTLSNLMVRQGTRLFLNCPFVTCTILECFPIALHF